MSNLQICAASGPLGSINPAISRHMTRLGVLKKLALTGSREPMSLTDKPLDLMVMLVVKGAYTEDKNKYTTKGNALINPIIISHYMDLK